MSGCNRLFRGPFLKFGMAQIVCVAILLLLMAGCQTADPGARFIAQMDNALLEKRPKDWERTKDLMSRPVPAVGQPAPDFTLPTLDGIQMVTRSGSPRISVKGLSAHGSVHRH
jgi:hypothetical protein